ncbi:MAG: ABC-F family ATP-binding cassette domain-containing protein [Proteobacteria bacterium]|nr:ABC-F family ATP-binding cassette domain-containing protein [Pseudomonadota bacterium]
MSAIRISEMSMAYGGRVLFEKASQQFDAGKRYGIVGANGSGKSTLLRALSGEEEPTLGSVEKPASTRVGALKQDHFEYDDVPILDVVLMGQPELWSAMQEREELLAAPDLDLDRYGEVEDQFVVWGGYAAEAAASEILEGLAIPTAVHREPLSILSGGFKLRVLLAQLLASEPDVLLLDEPTNHLDIVSIAWLEQFLLGFKACAIIVSHDHRFLNTTCTHIVDVDYERVTVYPGNYESFELAKACNRERKEAEISKVEAKKAEQEAFVRRFKAKASKARQAQSRVKQIAKMTVETLPTSSRRKPLFKLGARRQTGKRVLEVKGLNKAYGDNQVLSDVTFTVLQSERVAVIGANGIGKSTLLKILVGALEADAGTVEWGHEAQPGWFQQDQGDIKSHESSTLLDWLWSFCADMPTGHVRGKLAEVHFRRDDVDKKIRALSGGELTRLSFARLGVQQPTVLVLDEPSNHLDLEGIEALSEGLNKYPNAILFVSHDRWLVSKVATRIIAISEDGVDDFAGTYEEYLHHSRAADHLDVGQVIDQERKSKRERKRKKKKGKR